MSWGRDVPQVAGPRCLQGPKSHGAEMSPLQGRDVSGRSGLGPKCLRAEVSWGRSVQLPVYCFIVYQLSFSLDHLENEGVVSLVWWLESGFTHIVCTYWYVTTSLHILIIDTRAVPI